MTGDAPLREPNALYFHSQTEIASRKCHQPFRRHEQDGGLGAGDLDSEHMVTSLRAELDEVQALVGYAARPLRANDIARILDVDRNEAWVALRLLWRARRLRCTSDGAWVPIARKSA
jgi:hypothetical protein